MQIKNLEALKNAKQLTFYLIDCDHEVYGDDEIFVGKIGFSKFIRNLNIGHSHSVIVQIETGDAFVISSRSLSNVMPVLSICNINQKEWVSTEENIILDYEKEGIVSLKATMTNHPNFWKRLKGGKPAIDETVVGFDFTPIALYNVPSDSHGDIDGTLIKMNSHLAPTGMSFDIDNVTYLGKTFPVSDKTLNAVKTHMGFLALAVLPIDEDDDSDSYELYNLNPCTMGIIHIGDFITLVHDKLMDQVGVFLRTYRDSK